MKMQIGLQISDSVGVGGRNKWRDVVAVQKRLNALMPGNRVKLKVDGICGAKTARMLRDFQMNAVRKSGTPSLAFKHGLIYVGGESYWALATDDTRAIWAGKPVPRAQDVQPPKGRGAALNGKELEKYEQLFTAVANETKDHDYTTKMIDALLKDYGASVKAMLATMGLFKDTKAIAATVKMFKDLGLNPAQTAKTFGVLLTRVNVRGTLSFVKEASKVNGSLLKNLKALGKPLAVAGIFVTAVECFSHYQKSNYGAIAAEVWKLVTTTMIPWVAAVDALQSILEGFSPYIANSKIFMGMFKVLKMLNLAGASSVAVDSAVTLLQMATTALAGGKVNSIRELDKLVNRMKGGSLQVVAEFGEYLGDKAWDFYAWLKS